MKITKKALSVLLAVIMIMSSMSVCFGTFSFAANDTNALNSFVSAMKCNAMKNATISGPSKNGNEWTYTISASSYADYEAIANVLTKLDAAVKGLDEYTNGETHNNSGKCTDGWVDGTTHVTDTGKKNKCTDSLYLLKYLKYHLGDSNLADLAAYNVDALFNAVFNMHEYNSQAYRGADGNTDDNNGPQASSAFPSWIRNVVVVETSDVKAKMLEYGSIDAIPADVNVKTVYKMSNVQGLYEYKDGCDTKQTYHFAINTNNSNCVIGVSTTTGATNQAKLATYWSNYNSTYSAYINAADAVAILNNVTNDVDTLNAALNGINDIKTNVEKDFNTAIYNKFFKASFDTTTKKIQEAINFFAYETLADEIKRLYAIDFSRMDIDEILAHLTAFREAWQAFEDCAPNLQDLIAETYDLNPAAIRERIQEISDRYDSLRLTVAKVDIQKDLDLYAYLDQDYVDQGDDEGAEAKAAMKSEVFAALAVIYADKQYIDSFPDYLIADVFGADLKAALDTRYDELSNLANMADINVEVFAKYMTFVNEVTPATAEELGNEAILEGVKKYDAWSKALKDYLASVDAALSAEDAKIIYDNLNNIMLDYINAVYTTINTRVESQINYAWDLYSTFKAAYGVGSGTNINFKNVSHYNHIKQSVGRIDVPAYEFLCESQYLRISQDAIDKYNTLVVFELPDYQTFINSFGFSEYSQTTIPEFTREETSDDIARDGDYTVTDANIENVIKDLDALLGNAEIQKLLGQLINKDKETGEWTGESFDLGAMLTDLIKGALFTDGMINTVVGMLYPLVVTEFIKVWANDLPADNAGYPINYKKNLYNVFTDSGFNVYPDLLAKSLKNVNATKYSEIITALNAATNNFKNANGGNYYTLKWSDADGKNVADKTPWDEAVLKKNVIDEETGEVVLNDDGTPKTEWALDWGVDAKREELEAGTITQEQFDDYFYQTFDDAVDGLKPLLLALLGNKAWKPVEVDELGTTKQKVLFEINITIGLQLGATANRGYANLIIPVYEALGITDFKTASQLEALSSNSNPAADILKGILDPIFNFANTTLKNAPLTTVLNLLPNLAYALITDMVPELLDMLKTSITYKAVPYALGFDVSAFADISGGADISVGSMLNLKDMGVDLSDGLNSLLPGFGLNLPNIDQGALATMGKLTQISTGRAASIYTAPASGKAYHIEANKADVLLFLIDYALGSDLLSTFGLEIPEEGFVGELFAKLSTADTREDILAAIVELLNQKKYDTLENYKWYNGYIDNVEVGTLTDPAVQVYLNPENDWTEEKAQYLYENIDAIVGAILKMANLDLDASTEEVDGSIGELIGGVFSAETLTSLARLLGSISDINALLAPKADEEAAEGEETPDASEPETVAEGEEATEGEAAAPAINLDINALIKEFLGVDLKAAFGKYAEIPDAKEDPDYVYDFGKEIKTAADFAAVLADMLAPLSPVLDFILEGKNLEIKLSDSQKVNLIGYNGYDNAIVPILEALGCDVKALGSNDALALTLAAIAGKIDALVEGNTIQGIIDILPGLFYFVAGNGLSTAIRNLLQPVYVILDTIRPIYDVDLAELLAGIEINGAPLNLDLNTLNLNFVFDLVKNLIPADIDLGTLLDDVKGLIYSICKIVGVEYESVSTLAGQKTWKKGAYSEEFSQADLITVLLSFVLDWATEAENAAKLDALLGTDGLIASIVSILGTDVEISYGDPNWMYWFKDKAAFEAYLAAPSRINTLATLDWENIKDNDWDLETAQYFAENIGALVDTIIGMIEINGKKYESVSVLLNDLVNGNLGEYFTAETINTLVGYISGVLANVDDVLLDIGYEILNVDLAGIKNYTCKKEIATLDEFLAELGYVLDTYAQGILDLLFFGDDIKLAKKSTGADTIVINGGEGYAKGLAIILEALGCDVPVVEEATATNVLAALAARVDEILANPVNEVLDLLPNLIYALNANAAGVAVNNLLGPVNALLDKINGLGLLENEINISKLLTVEIGGEKVALLQNLALANVVEIIEGATGLPLDAAEAILVNFCTGTISAGKFGYKMEAAREDVITIILYVALELISNDAFAAKLDEMLGTDFIAGIKKLFENKPVSYESIDWNYPLADNGTVDAMKYSITYPNDWTEGTAAAITAELPAIGDMIAHLIDGNYATLSALLNDKVNIFTTETLQSIIDLVAGLLGDINENLLAVGYELLEVDLVGLKNHKVAEVNGVEEFAAELANILGYAKGAVEWLLLGRDFKLLVKDTDGIGAGLEGEAYITINGAEGYAEGLALLLEALGCENLPAADGETQAIIDGVLASLAARIDEIFAKPVEEVIDLLPNLLYFLNANGVAAVIKNTTAAVMALVEKLSVFGVELDLNELVNLKKLMGLEGTNAQISLDNLSMAAILEAVGLMVGLDLTLVKDVLVGFALGQVSEYDSVSANAAYKMTYKDEFDKHDMLTVLVNVILLTFVDDKNVEFVKGLIGEAAYEAILNVINIKEAEIKTMSWIYTDKVGEKFSPIDGSADAEFAYGKNFTEAEAQYIADNFGIFVDNIIKLIGIKVNGVYVNSLSELLEGLVGGGLYNSGNVIAIRDALAGILAGIGDLEVSGVNAGQYIKLVLNNSLGIDLDAVAKVEVPEFTEDKAQFVEYLAKVLDPLGPILNWVLTDRDIAFFADLEKTDFINLPGAEGYKNGIVLLLEALGCENIVDPADLDVNASGAAIVTAIIEPLLNKLDVILADPANEIFAILPNLVYFINSNGVDVVVKNTLNAVFTVLSAIEPIAKLDLYELIGLDLSTITFNSLFEMLLDVNVSGFSFEGIEIDSFNELTIGTLETYDSLSNEEPAYRMVYGDKKARADMVTAVLTLIIKFVTTEGNQDAIVALLKSIGMTADGEKYVAAMIEFLATCVADTSLGMDAALYSIYYVYYGVDKGASEVITSKEQLSNQWVSKLEELNKNASSEKTEVGTLITDIFDIIFETDEDGENGVLDNSGVASNGFLSFFQKIANFFKEIGDFFRNLFSFGR